MNEINNKLRKLIIDNPDLPIVPVVLGDLINNRIDYEGACARHCQNYGEIYDAFIGAYSVGSWDGDCLIKEYGDTPVLSWSCQPYSSWEKAILLIISDEQ